MTGQGRSGGGGIAGQGRSGDGPVTRAAVRDGLGR